MPIDSEDKKLFANPTNLELLRLAKELAYSDYNNRKAELHNQWIKESDLAWKLHRAKVAYPNIPDFPSESEIINRALKLIEFLNTPRTDLSKPVEEVVEPVTEVTEDTTNSENNTVNQTSDTATNTDNGPTQKQPQVLPIEQDLSYAKIKVQRKLDNGNSRDIAGTLIQKLNDIKLTWKK